MLYTAQYRYSGPDRLDITVKGQDNFGKWLAPTWDLVMGVKKGTLTEEMYAGQYYALLNHRWATGGKFPMSVFINSVLDKDITVVCFCPAETFCHRYLLVEWLKHNWKGVQYGGER